MTKIIIKRNSEWNNKVREIGIYVDGEKVGTINDGETQEYEIESGKHEVFAKIDWCRSQKIELNTSENETVTLKLTGFKYGAWILPIMFGFMATYYLLTSSDLQGAGNGEKYVSIGLNPHKEVAGMCASLP